MNTPNEMTLRDWFAGQALAGMLAFPDDIEKPDDWIARNAWDLSDAMLAERERRAKAGAEKAEREAREWVASAGLTAAPNAWGGVYLMDGGGVIGCGRDLVAAVADARAMLAAKPTPPAPGAHPAPSTPTAEDDEAWAYKARVSIEPHRWTAWYAYTRDANATGLTIAAALRALRAKVEGGAR